MAQRPVYIPNFNGRALVHTHLVTFEWFAGLAVSQKQKSIDSLHDAAREQCAVSRVLEISSKSRQRLGVALSAFNLTLKTERLPRGISVECAFQGSKVFEAGGPYVDLFDKTSIEAKRDPRLQASGRLTGFRFEGVDWPLEPPTAFYDWLYITALSQHAAWLAELDQYDAFTDIEFNPERSVNCQANAAALYRALAQRGEWQTGAIDRDRFLRLVGERPDSRTWQVGDTQSSLF
jgi:hypothetical protein